MAQSHGDFRKRREGMSSRVPSDDPRRPQAVHKFYRERLDPDQVPPDYFSLLALAFGISGLMLKLKACAWLSVFSCMVSVANIKQSEADFKQLACSIMFSTMTVIMNYTAAGMAHRIPPGPGGATSPPVPPAV